QGPGKAHPVEARRQRPHARGDHRRPAGHHRDWRVGTRKRGENTLLGVPAREVNSVAYRRVQESTAQLMTLRIRVVLVTVAGAWLLCATAASAQSPYGSVRGYVYGDQKAVLPGATVTASAPDAPGVFTATSDGEGLYRLVDVPPGTYRITAELPNFAKFTRQPVIVRAGLNVLLDVDMRLGDIAEALEVRAEPPLLESRQPVQAINIAGDFQRSVPILPRRNWADFMVLTPGVSVGSNNLALFFWVHGVDFDEHVIQLDGADIASGQQNQLSYISLNPDALQDVEVKLAGVDASAQMGFGAAISAVAKSGTNNTKGSLSQLMQPVRWNDQNV